MNNIHETHEAMESQLEATIESQQVGTPPADTPRVSLGQPRERTIDPELTAPESEHITVAMECPSVVITPALVSSTGGGFAALALGRTIHWSSSSRLVLDEVRWWIGTYETFGREIGATKAAMRAAADKLDSAGLIVRRRNSDHLLLSLGDFFPDRSPKQQVYVPTIFVLVCNRDANAAIVLSDLVFWTRLAQKKESLITVNRRPGWIMKTTFRLHRETGLTESKLNGAIGRLESLGFVECCTHRPLGQVRRKRHFRIDWRALFAAINRWERDARGVWSLSEEES